MVDKKRYKCTFSILQDNSWTPVLQGFVDSYSKYEAKNLAWKYFFSFDSHYGDVDKIKVKIRKAK